MTKFIFSLVLSTLVTNILPGQQSALNKLVDRLDELKKISADKQEKINSLRKEIYLLKSESRTIGVEVRELRKVVKEKTEELLIVSGQLSDITYEYAKLIKEVERLSNNNEQANNLIARMKSDSTSLSKDLKKLDNLTKTLTDSLRAINLRNEILSANEAALTSRMNELLNSVQWIFCFESEFNFSNGVSGNFIYGKLMKGNNLFFGGKIGYTYFWQEDNLPYYKAKFIPISVILRSALSRKKKLGFYYTNPYKNTNEPPRLFGSIELGYGVPVGKIEDNFYNVGGVNLGFGIGLIFNSNENVNPYVLFGYKYQSLGYKSKSGVDSGENGFRGFHLSGGIYF